MKKIKSKGQQRTAFINSAILNGGQPIFYLIKCWDKQETFYKLGITTNHVLTRYGSVRSMPYEWEILLEHPDTAEAVYDMEVAFKTEMNQFHYSPQISFNGSKTECYTKLSEILQELTNETNTY